MTEPPRPGEGASGSAPDPGSPAPPSTPYSVPGEAPSPDVTPPPAGQYEPPQYAAPQYQDPGAAGYPPPAGGYDTPGYGAQPGGYPPPGGYGAAPGGYGYPGVPAGYATSDDKTWALIAHFGGAGVAFLTSGVGGWIAPLVALLAKGNQSPTVRAHAVAALNFQITWTIVAVIGYLTMCLFIGFLIVPAAWLVAIIVGIIAGVKANDGQPYRYPLSISMIK